jgi:hypothetical protein
MYYRGLHRQQGLAPCSALLVLLSGGCQAKSRSVVQPALVLTSACWLISDDRSMQAWLPGTHPHTQGLCTHTQAVT